MFYEERNGCNVLIKVRNTEYKHKTPLGTFYLLCVLVYVIY